MVMTINPNFKRFREAPCKVNRFKNKVIQEEIRGAIKKDNKIIEIPTYFFFEGANHIATKRDLIQYCTFVNPEALAENKTYLKTGQYKSKNSDWLYTKIPYGTGCQFPQFEPPPPSYSLGPIKWGWFCKSCKREFPKNVFNNGLCPECISKETNNKRMIQV